MLLAFHKLYTTIHDIKNDIRNIKFQMFGFATQSRTFVFLLIQIFENHLFGLLSKLTRFLR